MDFSTAIFMALFALLSVALGAAWSFISRKQGSEVKVRQSIDKIQTIMFYGLAALLIGITFYFS